MAFSETAVGVLKRHGFSVGGGVRAVKAAREVIYTTIPAAAGEIRSRAEAEARDYTKDEAARIEGLAADRLVLEEALVAERNAAEAEAFGGKSVLAGNGFSIGGDSSRPWTYRGGRRFVEMFGPPADAGVWKSEEEYLATVHAGLSDPRLLAASSVGVPSSGGFLAPEEFAARWLDASLENEIVRPRANVEPMASDTKKTAGLGELDHNTIGPLGLATYWVGENDSITEANVKARNLELHARKLACYVKASNELRADGVSWEQQLSRAMVGAIGWGLDYAFLRGTGAGQPLGVLNDPALVSVAKESGQLAATIQYENVVKMVARLHPSCFGNSVWVASSTTIPQLLTMTVGIGAALLPVLKESNGTFSMLTRPVIFTEKLPALGTVGDLILSDFSQYTIGLRKEITLDASAHVGFQADQTAYRCIARADGQGTWNQAFVPKTGDSQSWAVALATRS